METKNSTEINRETMNENFFSDVMDMMYDNVTKTEELYNIAFERFNNNNNAGFSLGVTKTSADMIKSLSEIRATAVTATKTLFDAKKSVVELELKKRSQTVEEDKAANDKEFIRAALSEIGKDQMTAKKLFVEHRVGNTGSRLMSELTADKSKLDSVVSSKLESGELTLTKNEKAMKYDFNNEVDYVYDTNSQLVQPVRKGTTTVISDYPRERIPINKIVRVDLDEKKAYSDTGTKLRVVAI
ncbi:MAG: hypothetical protein IJ772_04820 [Bacilli bacterium]|nr:hypothetical protein [Bacilli bacterium]